MGSRIAVILVVVMAWTPAWGQSLQRDLEGRAGAASANGRFIAGVGGGGGAAIWALGTGWVELGGGFPGLFVSGDGAVLVAGDGAASEVWEEGTGWRPIGAARALALSSDGVSVALHPAGSSSAAIWNRVTGSTEVLPLPAGATAATIRALSADGGVAAGAAEFPGVGWRALVWDRTAGSLDVLLPPDPNLAESTADGVSENGEWVVGSRGLGSGTAYRWNRGTGIVELPAVQPSAVGIERRGLFVSDDGGTIFGERILQSGPNPGAFVWTLIGGTQSFDDWLLSQGSESPGPFVELVSASEGGERFLLADGDGAAPAQIHYDKDALVSFTYCSPAAPNSTGSAARLVALGSNVAPANALFLLGQGLPPMRTVVPAASRTRDSIPLAGGGPGTLCLGGSIGRLAIAQSDAGGTCEVQVDTLAIPNGAGTASALAGQTWNFQMWFRESAGGGSNLTDGASVFFD